MSGALRNQRAECSEPIRRQLADFIVREKARQRIKTSVIGHRIGRARGINQIYNDISRLQYGDTSGVGLEYLLRLVEAVGYTVEVSFVPKVTEASRKVAEAA